MSKLFARMPDWSSNVPTIFWVSAQQYDTCEGLIACIEDVESRIPKDRSFGVIIELLRRIVTVLRSPQLVRSQTDQALHDDSKFPREVEHTGRLDGVCQWYEAYKPVFLHTTLLIVIGL